MIKMWLSIDWDAPEPALRALEGFLRAVRESDPAQLAVAAGALSEREAFDRLNSLMLADAELSPRVKFLPDIAVVGGDVPDDVEPHLRLPGPGEQALRVLREELSPYVALTPVLNQAEWARTFKPEPGFRHLIVDNASDDDTAQILSDRGADVVVMEQRVSRVENWRRALDVFLEVSDADWMKWLFAGDRLLPGAAELLDAATSEFPDVKFIAAQYEWKHLDGGVTKFRPSSHAALVGSVAAMERFAVHGNWIGGPMGIALHRDALADLEFGAHDWVADWQASMSLARKHDVLVVPHVIGRFDASRGRNHTARERDVSTIIQDAAMRYQALDYLRQVAPSANLDKYETRINAWVANEAVRRVQQRDTRQAPPAARVKFENAPSRGGAARMRLGAGRGAVGSKA